ncbi:amidohydrolase family protein [Thermogutta sp.]|jgi:N-acetylglucosamine-6-phosphate deacetylase|uniref:N-acetylglucosamine-6-phosphate deacetylase n=1 Tax=Thermogutta sp. TaxID=1962930 RepID=UPI0032206B40
MSTGPSAERIVARDVLSGEIVALTIKEDRIVSLERGTAASRLASDSRLPWIAPALCDIQVNGYGGHDFTSPDLSPEDVWAVTERMLATGVTCFLPTITTQSREVMIHAVRTIAQAVNEYPLLAQTIPGIHLEGPYISPEDGPRGAHPREHVRPPDWEEFCQLQEAATGLIRLITLSPEYPEALPFIEKAVDHGVTVAIGHTAASLRQLEDAVSAGAQLSTHLGNGCHLMLPRHPNYLWHQLAEDQLWASFIFDGYHLPQDFMIVALRAKGIAKSILVSDVTGLAGMPPGIYRTPLGEVEMLPEGRLVVAGQRQLLAGAAQPLVTGIVNAIRWAGCSVAEAFRMASINPRALLGLPSVTFQAGAVPEFILFELDPDLVNEQRFSRSEHTKKAASWTESGIVRVGHQPVLKIQKVYFQAERYPR